MNFFSNIPKNQQTEQKIQEVFQTVLQEKPSFLDIEKNSFVNECKEALEQYKAFKKLLVLGIGGSALGTQSVIQALRKENTVQVIDTIDPEEFEKILNSTDWRNTVVNVISKSGGTLETMLQFSAVEKKLKEIFPNDFQKRIICTTGAGSLLDKYAQKNRYQTLPVPDSIGGRFSVFTPVGIFPLMFAGVDVKELIEGAKSVETIHELSLQIQNIVSTQYIAYTQQKRNITVLISYQKKLMGLLDWYRQLLAESLGKNINTGITPALAFGSTDQHSQIQLYCEGPQDKLMYFLSAPLIKDTQNYSILGGEKRIGISQTQEALAEGTKKSLEHYKRPFCEYQLSEISEIEIGKFFMTHMISIAVLAKLFDVNAFDQPGVEEGKVQAKKILGV